MSAPAPEAEVTPARSIRDLAAPVVSALCLVHCIGVAVLAPLLPAALTVFSQDPRIEWALWLMSAGLGMWMLRRSRALLAGWVFPAWCVAAAAGLLGILFSRERLLQASLTGLAALQILAFSKRVSVHRATHRHDACGQRLHRH